MITHQWSARDCNAVSFNRTIFNRVTLSHFNSATCICLTCQHWSLFARYYELPWCAKLRWQVDMHHVYLLSCMSAPKLIKTWPFYNTLYQVILYLHTGFFNLSSNLQINTLKQRTSNEELSMPFFDDNYNVIHDKWRIRELSNTAVRRAH